MNTPNTTKQLARPMTSVRAAGYSSTVKTPSSPFDPFNMALKIDKNDPIKLAEKKVSNLINESVLFGSQGNWQSALETAKESAKHERQILKLRDTTTSEPPPQPNLDLSYCVLINLATCFHALKMYPEALAQYAAISKNKSFNQSGRLRVNMGNIYFEQGKYTSAIKMYRMALDQIGNHNNDIRLKIMRNVGVSFIKMGQYQEAITSFESIAEGNRDSRAGKIT